MENSIDEIDDTLPVPLNPLKRPRLDDDVDGRRADGTKPTSLYHDVKLARHTHAHLRIFILPNAWICVKIYTHDSHLFKENTFSFPRMKFALHDGSVVHELGEWNGKGKYNYDMISIAMVLADLKGDELQLRDLEEIDIEARDERVLKCLTKQG